MARKVVTILFADLVGSTSLQERLDAESTRRVMERYYAAMRAPVEAQRGTVVQLLGDGVMCAFGVPHVAEDDAIRAVRAAVAMQQAFREFVREEGAVVGSLGLRIAVNTGEVVVSDERPQGIGDPLNVAGRLQQEAREGDVLVGEATRRLVGEQVTLEHFGTFALRGRGEPVPAYRVVSLERPAGAPAIPFVGREDELRRLTLVYDLALAAPAARLATILGSPGLGKSRLLDEFARRLGGRARVLTARCDSSGGATFAPLAAAIRALLPGDEAAIGAALPPDEPERARIAAGITALLAGTPASSEETFFVVRRLLTALAAQGPVVLAIDDVQWAEPLLLDLTEHLVQWGAGMPLAVLVAARPELRDTRSSLTMPGGLVSEVVTLGGLDAGAAARLAANVVGADELPAALAGRVLATSEGNPLFVGELVRMLVQDGALKRDGDRWTTGVALADVEMPPTIHALLAARIERLRHEERTVLERAAVVGRHFSRAAVSALLPRELENLDARLESLRRSELIEPDTGWFLGEPALRFHHALIRDAAYRRVLRGTRAELHERFADWIASRVGDSVEHDETIGWHLEQAHQQLRELGPVNARGRELGERASKVLAAAGRRALARDDLPVAANLLGRALERLDPADPARAELLLDRCESLLAAGDVAPATAAIAELAGFGAGSPRLRAWHTCFAGQLAALTNPQSLEGTASAVAAAAQALAAAGDTAGEAKAHSVHALALQRLGKVGACEAALDLALAAARRVRDRRRSNAVLAGAPLAALWGPSPVTRASGRCLDVVRVLRITQGSPAVEAVALRCQAVLEALRGRTEAARRMLASSRRMVEELGLTPELLETDVFSGLIDLLEGDPVAAERSLRGAYEGLREHGLGIDAARAAALLARALLAQGRVAEGEALSEASESLAGDDLQAAISWRGARAQALVRRGEHARAVEFARAAVEIAAETDALLHHADARSSLATALRAAGRSAEAEPEERRALELWEAKGATLLAERARRAGPQAAQTAERSERAPAVTRPSASAPLATLGGSLMLRRVRANAATAQAARLEAAVRTRDERALAPLFDELVEVVEHATGAVFDGRAMQAVWGSLVRAQSPIVRSEPLATLGDSLALFRTSMSFSALAAGDVAPFGAVTREEIVLVEAGPTGHQRRIETFAPDHLADAVARLYERHADSLPEGPARLRARATARVIGVLMAPPALEPYRTVFAPDVAWADHRTLGFGSLRGSKALLGAFQSLFDSSAELAVRVEDVLALESNALLVRWTVSGTDRAGGGAFERQFLLAWAFGEDGLVIHSEQFDADDVDIALARIEQLAVESPEARVTRRVRLNAATANAARTEAAVAARDFEAFQGLFADGARNVHHPTGSAFAESESMESYRRLLNAEEVAMRHEPLATLGDSLALFRASVSFRSLPSSDALGPFGAVHTELLLLLAVDGAGRRRLSEVFAPDRLGDAVTRSYELFAEAVPEGPARTRAEATARSIATMVESLDPDRFATAIAPGVEFADHGPIGIGSSRGEKAILRGLAALHGLAAEVAVSEEDVLAMQPDLLLTRCTTSGTDRASGGPFERHFLALWVFGSDGLATRVEWFAPDGEAEAFARIDALTSPVEAAQPRVRPNAATANATRLDAAAAARDFAAFKDQFAEGAQVVHHPTATTFAQSRNLQAFEWLLQAPAFEFANRPIATLGDSLALLRASLWVDATTDQEIGETVNEWLLLTEVDAEGRRVLSEFFPTDRASDAIVRLYERYAESLPEGEARNAAERVARSLRAMFDAPDLERLGRAFGPEIELVDRSALGMWSARGVAAALEHFRTLAEVASNVAFHDYEILRLEPRAALVRRTHSGIDRANGGAYETRLVLLLRFGGDGRLDRVEWFDADRETEAQARFDELTAESWTRRRQVRPNAATANAARVDAAIAARDLDALARAFAQQAEIVHHPTGAAYDQRGVLSNWRSLLGARDVRFATLPLATLGDSLALCRGSVSFSSLVAGNEESFGAVAKEEFLLIEVDAAGRRTRIEFFALDRLADAITRLYERYAESLPQGPRRERAAEAARSASLLASPFEFDRSAQALARDVTFVDHRPLGLGTGVGVEGLASWLGSLPGTTDDLVMRIDDVLVLLPDQLLVTTTSGGRFRASGGTFEQRSVQLYRTGPDGRVARVEWFDPEKLDDALARSDELAADSTSLANLASRTMREFERAWRARDWNAVLATFVPTHHMDDRRRLMRVAISGADFLANERMLFEGAASEWRGTLLATRGGRLALLRMRFRTEIEGSGPMAVEMLDLVEVDAAGRRSALVVFDLDDLEAAYAELDRRYLAGEGAPVSPPVENAATRSLDRLTQAWASRDWEGVVATLGAGFRQIDRRPMMQLDLDREQFLAFMREVYDMSSSRLVFEILATRGSRLALARLRFEGADDSLGFTEIESLAVLETDAQGMRQAMVRFPTDDLAAAQRELEARYAALEGSQSSDPLLIPPNAASRTGDRLQRAIEVRDWDGVRALFAPVLEYEDRRRGAQLQGDHETFLASARTYAANQERMKRTLLATAGDRHSLTLLRRSGTTPDVEAWEVESLSLLELDAEGRIARVLAFDPSDRSKASAEMFERYARGEGASALSPLACEGIRAMNARDLERLRAALPDDFVLCDRRRTGLGLIRGAGAFIRSLAALFEVSRESWVETLYTLELQPHGELAMARVLGTLRDGGAFESAYLRIITREGSMELFEPEDLELARARFEELRPK